MEGNIDMRKEIISSYEMLIQNCKLAIENGVEIEKNEELIDVYKSNLKEVKRKPQNAYDDVLNEMKRVAEKMSKLSRNCLKFKIE